MVQHTLQDGNSCVWPWTTKEKESGAIFKQDQKIFVVLNQIFLNNVWVAVIYAFSSENTMWHGTVCNFVHARCFLCLGFIPCKMMILTYFVMILLICLFETLSVSLHMWKWVFPLPLSSLQIQISSFQIWIWAVFKYKLYYKMETKFVPVDGNEISKIHSAMGFWDKCFSTVAWSINFRLRCDIFIYFLRPKGQLQTKTNFKCTS